MSALLRAAARACLPLLVCCLMATGLPAAWATPAKQIEIDLVSKRDRYALGEAAPVTLTVAPAREATTLTLQLEQFDAAGTRRDNRSIERRGPWSAARPLVQQIDARRADAGTGLLRITIRSLDAARKVIALRRAEVHTLVDANGVWLSTSSLTDARIRRAVALGSTLGTAQAKAASGAAPAAAGAAETIADIVTTKVAEDHETRPQLLDAPALRLQQIYKGLAVPAPAQPQAKSAIVAAAAVAITVSGKAEWTDSAGNKHGIPMATVEIRDSDLIGSELITTVTTDAAGRYSTSFSHDDGIGQGNPDIFVRVLARSPVADITPDSLLGSTYQLESPVTDEVAGASSLTINLTATRGSDAETAFGVHHALVVIGGYAGNLAGAMPSRIGVRFPTTKHTSLFDGSNLHILRADRDDWDVIHHEYGHYFMAIHGIQNNPGGAHSFNQNLASSRGSKDIGVRLAWGEGWPTYFGISGQQVAGAAALGIPNVGDSHYQDTDDASTDLDLEPATGLGEDNEVSVMAALWDLYDGANDGEDRLALGDRALFNAFKGAGAKTVGAAWEALAASRGTRERTQIGGVLGQAKIAPVPKAPADNVTLKAGDPPPTFRWDKNGGGTPNPLNDFTVRFYKNDFSAEIFHKDVGNVDNWTPTAGELATILGGDTLVKWVVEGSNTSAPATPGGALGKYWSKAMTIGGVSIAFVIDDTGSMGEEIGGVRTALQAYIDSVAAGLPPGTQPPTIQVWTFKDDVTQRITSNDLNAVRGVVNSLFASGGGDCPEFGAQALLAASQSVSPGGTILFATDASSQPGVDAAALISELRAKGITVNTILSGDCSGIGGASAAKASRRAVQPGNQLADSSAAQKPGTGGDDEPPEQPPIDDPGQPVPDDHGDSAYSATPLLVNGPAVRGVLGYDGDGDDYFELSLQANRAYSIRFQSETGFIAVGELYDAVGGYLTYGLSPDTSIPGTISFVTTRDGNYYLDMTTRYYGGAGSYLLSVQEGTLDISDSAVELFSTISKLTGGVFVVRDDVNFGSDEAYAATVLNVISSTLGPAVLSAGPDQLPQGGTLSVTLTGRNTNWRPGAAVSFSGTGVTVGSVTVNSATSVTALVTVAGDAAAGFRDAEVRSTVGAAEEIAHGKSVVEVGSPITAPTLLSVEPATASRGVRVKLLVRGILTAWSSTSTADFGEGATLHGLRALSPTLIEADVTYASDTPLGFRTVSVDTQSRARGVFVEAPTAIVPVVSTAAPAEGRPGQTLDVTVTGSNTHFAAGSTTASFGPGITVLSVNVGSATRAVVRVRLDAAAASGFRDLQLSTGSETAVLLNGFFVAAPPVAGDVDEDGDVDRADLNLVVAARNQPASSPDDARDLDHDGTITVLDARKLVTLCTRPRCATE